MKKKIKNLTIEDLYKLCGHISCSACPLDGKICYKKGRQSIICEVISNAENVFDEKVDLKIKN